MKKEFRIVVYLMEKYDRPEKYCIFKKIKIKYVSIFLYPILMIWNSMSVTRQVNIRELYKTFISNYARWVAVDVVHTTFHLMAE